MTIDIFIFKIMYFFFKIYKIFMHHMHMISHIVGIIAFVLGPRLYIGKTRNNRKKNMGHKNLIIFKLNFRQILSAVNANIWISFFFKNVMVSKNHFTLGKVMEIFFSVHCDTKYCKCKLLL